MLESEERERVVRGYLVICRSVVLDGVGELVGVALLPHRAGGPCPAVPLAGPGPLLPGEGGAPGGVLQAPPPGDVAGRHDVCL